MALGGYDGMTRYFSADPTTGDLFRRLGGAIQYQIYHFGDSANEQSYSIVNGYETNSKGVRITTSFGYQQGLPTDIFAAVFKERAPDLFMGVRMKSVAPASMGLVFYDTMTMGGFGSPTVQCSVLFDQSNFSIKTYRGLYTTGTLLGSSAANVWSSATWQLMEVWPVISAGGSITVRVEGNTIPGCSVFGVNTNSSGNASWDSVGFQPENVSIAGFTPRSFDITDIYWGDTTLDYGVFPNNAPLGISAPSAGLHIKTLLAIGENSIQWTPKPTSPVQLRNYQEINEPILDSDVTYNFTTTIGNEDSYNYPPLPGIVSNIVAAQLTGAYRKTGAGARLIRQVAVSGYSSQGPGEFIDHVTASYGNVWSLPNDNYVYFTDLWKLDPVTGSNWTVTGLNGAAFGYKLVG